MRRLTLSMLLTLGTFLSAFSCLPEILADSDENDEDTLDAKDAFDMGEALDIAEAPPNEGTEEGLQNLLQMDGVIACPKSQLCGTVCCPTGQVCSRMGSGCINTAYAGTIYYSEYGAKGDGKTDDFDAIIKAHAAANAIGAQVRADAGKKYYIGGGVRTARIETDTDWTGAEFIVDDTQVQPNGNSWKDSWIFEVASTQAAKTLTSVKTLKKNQAKLNISLPSAALLVVTDDNTKHYIRRGTNQDEGASQTDVLMVDKNGNVNADSPVIWEFKGITSLVAYPMDEQRLTVKGGTFVTIANNGKAEGYMKRGIRVLRSNTVIDGLIHKVTGEGAHGAPYLGFIRPERCAYVTIKNVTLTGHKLYQHGSYDMNAVYTVNLSVINSRQTNSITDSAYWGIFASNYSKNILFDNVTFSRFDAHKGVHNASILNSELGHQGINIIGSGLLRVENTKVRGNTFINLRNDYGSTWDGKINIKNAIFAPPNLNNAAIISTNNDGKWNFGYACSMPETISIEKMTVEDKLAPVNYNGVLLVRAVNSNTAAEPFPYTLTKTIHLLDMNSAKPFRITTDYVKSKIVVWNAITK